jgi:hypothetical protein
MIPIFSGLAAAKRLKSHPDTTTGEVSQTMFPNPF